MKRLTVILFIFFIFTANVSVSFAREKIEERAISLDSSNLEYNWGILQKDIIIKITLKIINKLNENIKIKEARSSCECMGVKLIPQIVKINDMFEVEIIFDTTGISGDKESIVYIITENMKYELIRLKITSKIIDNKHN